LSAAEREWIGEGLAAGCSLRMIARHLKRSPSTISREVKRNRGVMRYSGIWADTDPGLHSQTG
jgi:IS30 family transposase